MAPRWPGCISISPPSAMSSAATTPTGTSPRRPTIARRGTTQLTQVYLTWVSCGRRASQATLLLFHHGAAQADCRRRGLGVGREDGVLEGDGIWMSGVVEHGAGVTTFDHRAAAHDDHAVG